MVDDDKPVSELVQAFIPDPRFNEPLAKVGFAVVPYTIPAEVTGLKLPRILKLISASVNPVFEREVMPNWIELLIEFCHTGSPFSMVSICPSSPNVILYQLLPSQYCISPALVPSGLLIKDTQPDAILYSKVLAVVL